MGDRRAHFAALGATTPNEAERDWPLVVRRARADDRDAVLRFATRTWDGWDYIPNAWPVWLEAADGVLLVGCVGPTRGGAMPAHADGEVLIPGQVVAVARVALLSSGEGWLEGIRVDPRVRGLGVGTDLQTVELHWLAAHQVDVVRYATGASNEASHLLGARHGIELIARYRTWAWRDPASPSGERHDEANGFDEAARHAASGRRREALSRLARAGLIASADQTGRWWTLVAGDPDFAAGARLYERRSWAVQELTTTLFRRHVESQEVIVVEGDGDWALAILSAEAMPAEDVSIHLALLAGDGAARVRLADTIRQLADAPLRFRVAAASNAMAGRDPELTAVGFAARPWELHVLGRTLDAASLPRIDPQRIVLADPPRRRIEPPA